MFVLKKHKTLKNKLLHATQYLVVLHECMYKVENIMYTLAMPYLHALVKLRVPQRSNLFLTDGHN